ncbi:hypothetical protein Tco_0467924 [Tanacetum coccineum]
MNSFRPLVIEDWNSNDDSEDNPQQKEYKEKGLIDSSCSRHMTGNKCYLTKSKDYDGGFVSFGDGNGPDWLFDVDSLTISMNYVSVVAGKQINGIVGTRDNIVIGQAKKKTKPKQKFILIPFCTTDPLISQGPKDSKEDSGMKPTEVDESRALDKDGEDDQATRSKFERPSCTDDDPSSPVNAAEASNEFEEHLFERFSPFKNVFTLPPVSNATPMDDTGFFDNAYDDEDMGAEADLNNLETTMNINCDEILKKFDFATVKTSSTPMEPNKALVKDEEDDSMDVHLYRSMIGSLMHLTTSMPDIIYLKGQPKLGLWYPRDSPFDLEAFSDSDYTGASLDRKSTTGGCQFLGKRLISWQCKKQTIVANSTTEVEYVVAANCCR